MPHALYDQTLKVLADSDPAALLSLLDALPPDTTTFVSPAPRELPLPARLPDLLYTVDANNTWLAHIELQIRDEARMDERMVEYMVLAWLWFRKPVKSFLILPTRGGMRPSPCSADTRAGDILLLVRYEVIRLWELPARQVLAMRRPSLLPFVPLMDSTEAEVVEAFSGC